QAAGVEIDALVFAAMLEPFFAASTFDEDAAHGLGTGGEEMAAAVPVRLGLPGLTSGARHQAQIGFVDQRGGFQRLARLLLRHPLGTADEYTSRMATNPRLLRHPARH